MSEKPEWATDQAVRGRYVELVSYEELGVGPKAARVLLNLGPGCCIPVDSISAALRRKMVKGGLLQDAEKPHVLRRGELVPAEGEWLTPTNLGYSIGVYLRTAEALLKEPKA